MLKIGFLGGGNMARAIVAGLVSSGADPKLVTVMDRHPEKLAALREQFGITTQEKPGDWITALDVVVLAVKPQGLKECCEQVASLVSPETTVLSIAAAVRADVIAEWLGGFSGLGVYMTRVRKAYSFDKMFAVIFLISGLSLVLMWVVDALRRALMPWERLSREP